MAEGLGRLVSQFQKQFEIDNLGIDGNVQQ
jgi:hypothetical protein